MINKRLKCLRKVNTLTSKILIKKNKIKSSFMIYGNLESILVAEDNGKQNPNESYSPKYQKHVACGHGYKLVCVDDKLSKPFKTYLGEDAV